MSVVFFRPRNCWRVQYTEQGKRVNKYFRTEQEAKAFDMARLAEKCEEEKQITMGELVVLFFRANPEKHQKTKKNIVYFFTGHEDENGKHIPGVGEFLRNKYAESLNRADLETMREAFRAKGTGPNTINKYQAYIRAILAWGVDQELIHLNPWRDYKRLKFPRHRVQATFEDFQKIIQNCPEWLVWALKTAYALAIRPGEVELFGLTWNCFSWRYGYVTIVQGKTGRVKRVIPPNDYWLEAKKRYHEDSISGIPWVCHRAGKKVLSYAGAWKSALEKAGLGGLGIRMYDIRHIAASEMLARGADLSAVAAQLGHASTQTTATTYAHALPHAQQRAALCLPPLVKNEESE